MAEHGGILLVGEKAEETAALQQLLVSAGYTLWHSRGEDALALAPTLSIELILCDLPDQPEAGFEICRKFKKQPQTHQLPVILLQAAPTEAARAEAAAAGADDFLSKPYHPAELLGCIQNHFKFNQLRNQLEARVKERTAELRAANRLVSQELAERKRAEERLKKEVERGSRLLQLYEKAPQLTDKELYDFVLDQAVSLTDSAIGFFHIISDDQKEIVLTTWNAGALKNCLTPSDNHYPVEMAGNWVDCLRYKRPIIYNDFPRSPNQKGLPVGHTPLRRFLSIPVMEGERVRIIFGVGNKPEDYHEQDVLQIQLVANDLEKIIRQRRAEEDLRENQTFLSDAQKIGHLGSWIYDPAGDQLFWSEETYRIFKRSPSDLINYDAFMQYVHPEDAARLRDAQTSARTGETQIDIEYRIVWPNGKTRYLYERSLSEYDKSGKNLRVKGTVRDITDRKLAEQKIHLLNQELELRVIERTAQLEAANHELEAFAYSVSHDLRAPLRHIHGFVDLLREELGGGISPNGERYMQVIADSAKQMGTLIDDLLQFSRMGRRELTQAPFDMGKMVGEVIEELQSEANGRQVDWQVAELPVVTGDRAMLRLVVTNLISNALKYTRPRAQARIEIGRLPESLIEYGFYVRDNGVGFDMQYVDKLFGVFQRLHRAEDFEGNGIGLAHVRRIISRHGGRTWAEGQVGQGATFYFTLSK